MRDFTIEKYGELCRVLLDAGYTPVTVYQYLTGSPAVKLSFFRHDADRKPENALASDRFE